MPGPACIGSIAGHRADRARFGRARGRGRHHRGPGSRLLARGEEGIARLTRLGPCPSRAQQNPHQRQDGLAHLAPGYPRPTESRGRVSTLTSLFPGNTVRAGRTTPPLPAPAESPCERVFLLSIGWARPQNGTDLPISSKVRDVSETPDALASPVCASPQIAGCADLRRQGPRLSRLPRTYVARSLRVERAATRLGKIELDHSPELET